MGVAADATPSSEVVPTEAPPSHVRTVERISVPLLAAQRPAPADDRGDDDEELGACSRAAMARAELARQKEREAAVDAQIAAEEQWTPLERLLLRRNEILENSTLESRALG